MSITVEPATFEKLVDTVLRAKGVPRNRLYEYPYNDYESRDLIKSAESTVREMLRILNQASP